MSLNLIPMSGPDRRRYCPDRDIAYCWPALVRSALNTLSDKPLPDEIEAFLKHHNVTDEMLGEAAEAYAKFLVVSATNIDCTSVREALLEAGVVTQSPANTAICAVLGMHLSGFFYAAIRDITFLDDEGKPHSPMDSKAMTKAGIQAYDTLRAPRAYRFLYSSWYAFKNWLLSKLTNKSEG